MSELALPYLFALAMTAGLSYLARRNRKRGWRRQRPESWLIVKPLETLPAAFPARRFKTSEDSGRVIHLEELVLLNNALLSHAAERVESNKVTHPL